MAKTRKNAKPTMSKADIVKISKNAVKSIAEKKYMDTNNALKGEVPTRPTGNDYISCIGYSTTTGDSDDGTPLLYGGTAVQEMLCLNPFKSNAADQDLRMFAPVGKQIQPVSCKSRWRINRQFARIDPALQLTAGVDAFPTEMAENCPVVCRLVRVSPKLESGTDTIISPADDLFLDEYGRATGVDNTLFDEAEMLFYKVNNRRYSVIEDKKFILRPPLTLQYQSVSSSQTGGTAFTPLVSNTNGNCEKYLTTYDQLTAKKNGSVFYTDPTAAGTNNATTGNKRSYYFWHFAFQGADAITGDGADRAKGPIDVVLDLVNTTKFIDV